MARNNYGFQKRSRELAKKKKKEEKRLRKQAKTDPQAAEHSDETGGEIRAAEVSSGSEMPRAGSEIGPVEGDR